MKKYLFTKRKFRHVVIGLLLSHVSLVSHASDSTIIENLPQTQFPKMGKFSKLLQKDLRFKEKHFESCNNFLNVTFNNCYHQFQWRLEAISEKANILFHKEMSDKNRIEMLKTAFKLQTEEINSRTNSFKTHEKTFSDFFPLYTKLEDKDSFKINLLKNYSTHETNTFIENFNFYKKRVYENLVMKYRISFLNIATNFSLEDFNRRINKIDWHYGDFLPEIKEKEEKEEISQLIISLIQLEDEAFNYRIKLLIDFEKLFLGLVEERKILHKNLNYTLSKIDTEEITKRMHATQEIFKILFNVDISLNTPIDVIASFFYKNEASKILSLKDMDAEVKVRTITSYNTDKLSFDFKNMEIKHQLQLIEFFKRNSNLKPEDVLKEAIEKREVLFPKGTFKYNKNEILASLVFRRDRVKKIEENSLYLDSYFDIESEIMKSSINYNASEQRYRMIFNMLSRSNASFEEEFELLKNSINLK